MTTDTTLIEKREELKRRLAAGEYKTLVDVFLTWIDRQLRKIIHRSKPLPIWLITVILSLVPTLVGLIASYLAGDLVIFQDLVELMGLGYRLGLLLVVSVSAFFITSIVVINQYIARIFVLWRDTVLDLTESVASLEEFEYWLERTCNWRLHLLVTIIGGLLFGSYFVAMSSTRVGVFVGYGSTFGIIISIVLDCTLLYSFWMVILLSARLRRYELKLFAADPSSSECVSRLSGVLDSIVYFVAVLAAYVTLISASSGFFLSLGIILVMVLWLPIIAMFILNHTGLSSIIRRAKWKTLNEIQFQVEELRASNNLKDKETMEAINRLMDFHDRVKATRNSALNSGAILSFINSLLLPLLAFLLGNLDKLKALLPQRP